MTGDTTQLMRFSQRFGKYYARQFAPLLAETDLTMREIHVLLFLTNNPGCDTASDMVQLRQLTKSHVSKAVERLTELGLVLQQRDEMNRRRIHLKLAAAAEPILREGREAQKRFVEVLTRGLSDEDKAAATRILTVMLKNAAALGQEA